LPIAELIAIDFLRVTYGEEYGPPSEDFAPHFAKLYGIRLYARKGGGRRLPA
jgi:hypothetical protein